MNELNFFDWESEWTFVFELLHFRNRKVKWKFPAILVQFGLRNYRIQTIGLSWLRISLVDEFFGLVNVPVKFRRDSNLRRLHNVENSGNIHAAFATLFATLERRSGRKGRNSPKFEQFRSEIENFSGQWTVDGKKFFALNRIFIYFPFQFQFYHVCILEKLFRIFYHSFFRIVIIERFFLKYKIST